MAPRLALAQSVLWQSLRTQLRADVAGTATSSRLLKSFDSLPYRSNIGRSWLPDVDDLRAVVGGSLSDRLEQSAESARVQLLQVASASDDPRGHVIDVIDKGARQGHLHAVLLQNQSSVDLELLMANCVVQLRRGELRSALQDIRREFSEFTISEPRLRWLRAVHYARQGAASPSESLFRTDLFRMLARYEGLAGLNGAGNQAAVPHQVYSCFESWAGAPNGSAVEAFASPLNHRMEPAMESRVQFGSAFPDVDAPFGSLGRFTELPRLPRGSDEPRLPRGSDGWTDGRTDGRTPPRLPRGSAHTLVLANPPFFQPTLDALEPKLRDLLRAAPDAIALCVVPATGAREPSEAPHVQALRASPLTRGSINLPAGEHAYASGVAHRLTWREPSATRRSTRHRWPSRYATEVFVMAAKPLEHRGVRELLEMVRVAFGVEDRHVTADLHASTADLHASTDGQASTQQHAPAPSRHRLRVVAASSVASSTAASSTATSADSSGEENLELEKGTRLFGCAPSGPAQRDLFDEVLLEASQRDAAARAALAHAKKRQNTRVYNRLLKNASDHRILSVVEEAVEQMRRDGVPENEFTTALRINAFARVGRIEDATAVVREAEARGWAPLQSNAALEPLIKGILETRFGPPGVGPEHIASTPTVGPEHIASTPAAGPEHIASRRPATALGSRLNRHPDQSFARLPQAHLSGTRSPPPSAARHRILSALHLVHDRLGVAGSEPPNWRTVNTLLRACKRWEPELGPHVLHSFDGSLHKQPSTLALCAEIACANLDVEGATAAVEGLRAQAVPPDPRLLIGLALAMALRGDLGGASATIDAAAASIESIALEREPPSPTDARAEGDMVAIHPLVRRGVPMRWLRAEHAMVARFVAQGGGVQEEGEAAEGAEQWSSSEGGASGSSTALMSSSISSPFRRSPLVSWPRELEGWTASDRLHHLLTSKAATRVEVGAGSGDWLVAQAAAQPDVAWVAIEPQVDRVYHIWSKVQMHRLSNVHICATDATDVLRREGGLMKHIIGSLDAIYLRFPFPPSLELRDLARTSPSPDALLNGAFLADAARVLRPLGSLKILTDEPACCALMLAILQTHPAGSAFRSVHGRDGFAKSGPTPATALDDSFFDAVLADRGRRQAHERYELHLRKVA